MLIINFFFDRGRKPFSFWSLSDCQHFTFYAPIFVDKALDSIANDMLDSFFGTAPDCSVETLSITTTRQERLQSMVSVPS